MTPDTTGSPALLSEGPGHERGAVSVRSSSAPDATFSKSHGFSSRGVSTAASPFVPRSSRQKHLATSIPIIPVPSSLPNQEQMHVRFSPARASPGRQTLGFEQHAGIQVPSSNSFNPAAMSLNGKTTDVKFPSENGFTSGLSDASAFSETLKRPFAHLHHVPLQLRAAFNNSNAQAAISSKMPSSIQMISNPAGQSKLTTRFTTEELYEELRRRIYLEREQTDELHACSGSLPRVLNQYHSLVPLDLSLKKSVHTFALQSSLLRGISSVDGMPYALRRLHHRCILPSSDATLAARAAVVRWGVLVDHPHIAALRGTFVSADMWDTPALFFAHEYHAGAVSLETLHCSESDNCAVASEAEIWVYASQLCCALKAVHDVGLSAGGSASLSPNKLLLCSKGAVADHPGSSQGCRIRLAALGVVDVLRPEAVGLHGGQSLATAQCDDLRALGISMAKILCGSVHLSSADALAGMSHRCSPMLDRVIVGLVSGGISDCSVFSQILTPIAFDSLYFERTICDTLKAELTKELDNGRLLRLLVKLSFINERPDGEMDPNWAETGDRYILKLFRDFIFHQHDNDGNPVIDWGHVFECLNKLDIGVTEQILLVSRDEMSMLVASYADIKRCTEGAYAELINSSQPRR